jgi:hypothetical protein
LIRTYTWDLVTKSDYSVRFKNETITNACAPRENNIYIYMDPTISYHNLDLVT